MNIILKHSTSPNGRCKDCRVFIDGSDAGVLYLRNSEFDLFVGVLTNALNSNDPQVTSLEIQEQ